MTFRDDVAFYMTGDFQDFIRDPSNDTWSKHRHIVGPYGYVYRQEGSKSVNGSGVVNNQNANSNLIGILSKEYFNTLNVKDTRMTCLNELADEDEKDDISNFPDQSITIQDQMNVSTLRSLETFEELPIGVVDEEDLNIDWGEFEDLKNS